jgi:GNAT superfamily N-acetyltransferase
VWRRLVAPFKLAAVSDGYAIRLARDADLPALPEIERRAAALFAEFGLAEIFARVLTPPSELQAGLRAGRLWVATGPDGGLVGSALAGVVGGNAHLEELDVLPEHGRQGIGTALVRTFLRWARAAGYPAATLTTLRHVPWNAPFYERLGFRVLGPDELTPALAEVLRSEIERGLPVENRVALWRPIP